MGASTKRGKRSIVVCDGRMFHDMAWVGEGLREVQLGWGMKLLHDSLMHLGMLPRRTSASLGSSVGGTCEEWGAQCGKLFISSTTSKYPPYFSPFLGANLLQAS